MDVPGEILHPVGSATAVKAMADIDQPDEVALQFSGYFTAPAPAMGALTRITSGIPAGR